MRRILLHLATLALVGSVAVAFPAFADARRPATEWLVRPSEKARVARVEAGLAPAPLPGEAPLHLSLQRWMELYGLPGLSIAVFDKHTLVWARSYGVKQAGGSDPVTLDTLFQAASISKPVTAMAVLHFAERRKWSLDANLNDSLVSWKIPDNDFTREQKVTLRRVLSHSSGLTVHGFPGYVPGAPLPTLVQILDGEKPANTPPVRVAFVPGTKTRYSGGGLEVVQLMLSDQLKKPFARIMHETVFAPLGLKHSTFDQPLPPALARTAAKGTRPGGKTLEGGWRIYPELAAAGLWTTPMDLATLTLEVLKARAGTSQRVLSRSMARQMLTRQSENFGLGFNLKGDKDRFGHGGMNEGFQSQLIAFADSGSGVVMMTQSDNGLLLFQRLAASVAAEYGWTSFIPRPDSPMVTADLLSRRQGLEAALAWVKANQDTFPPAEDEPAPLEFLGYRLMLEGNLPGAIEVFETNAELHPEDANAHENLGDLYVQAGRKAEAIARFERVLQLDPRNTQVARKLEELKAASPGAGR